MAQPYRSAEGYCESYRQMDRASMTHLHDKKCPIHNEAEAARWAAEFGDEA